MELELTIIGQVLVFLSISFGTLLAALAPRRPQPISRDVPNAAPSYVLKRGL